MEKKVYTNKDKKTCVVVLRNYDNSIIVKGKAVCHESDEYNEELGIKIANSRAWIKYYKELSKFTLDQINYFDAYMDIIQEDKEKFEEIYSMSNIKYEAIKQEYDALMKNI